jgi:hypothetical protein
MGCTTSSTKVAAERNSQPESINPSQGSQRSSQQKSTGIKAKKLEVNLEEEAKQRRSAQGKTENMVREEFDRGTQRWEQEEDIVCKTL